MPVTRPILLSLDDARRAFDGAAEAVSTILFAFCVQGEFKTHDFSILRCAYAELDEPTEGQRAQFLFYYALEDLLNGHKHAVKTALLCACKLSQMMVLNHLRVLRKFIGLPKERGDITLFSTRLHAAIKETQHEAARAAAVVDEDSYRVTSEQSEFELTVLEGYCKELFEIFECSSGLSSADSLRNWVSDINKKDLSTITSDSLTFAITARTALMRMQSVATVMQLAGMSSDTCRAEIVRCGKIILDAMLKYVDEPYPYSAEEWSSLRKFMGVSASAGDYKSDRRRYKHNRLIGSYLVILHIQVLIPGLTVGLIRRDGVKNYNLESFLPMVASEEPRTLLEFLKQAKNLSAGVEQQAYQLLSDHLPSADLSKLPNEWVEIAQYVDRYFAAVPRDDAVSTSISVSPT